jgi:hypothetical protein
MGEALGKSCDNFSTHVCVASAVSIAASLITEPPGSIHAAEKNQKQSHRRPAEAFRPNGNAKQQRDAKSTAEPATPAGRAGGRYKVKCD